MFKHGWNILPVALFVAASLAFACAGDDTGPTTGPTGPTGPTTGPTEPGEEELITTILISLSPDDGGTAVTARFRDLDGEGGNDPVVDKLIVMKGTNYNGTVGVLNETESPVEDITEEVMEEAEAHQFFYATLGGFSAATVDYADKESDYVTNSGADHPVGIKFTLSIPESAQDGQLRVTLSHYDDESKDGVNPSGETDIDVTFDVEVRT